MIIVTIVIRDHSAWMLLSSSRMVDILYVAERASGDLLQLKVTPRPCVCRYGAREDVPLMISP